MMDVGFFRGKGVQKNSGGPHLLTKLDLLYLCDSRPDQVTFGSF